MHYVSSLICIIYVLFLLSRGPKYNVSYKKRHLRPEHPHHPEDHRSGSLRFLFSFPFLETPTRRREQTIALPLFFIAMAVKHECCADVMRMHWSSARAVAVLTAPLDSFSLRLLLVDHRALSSSPFCIPSARDALCRRELSLPDRLLHNVQAHLIQHNA